MSDNNADAWLESRVVAMQSDDGLPGVLIQLPHGYIVVRPEDARRAAALILDVADEVDALREAQA